MAKREVWCIESYVARCWLIVAMKSTKFAAESQAMGSERVVRYVPVPERKAKKGKHK